MLEIAARYSGDVTDHAGLLPATVESPPRPRQRQPALSVPLSRSGPRLAAWTLGFAPVLYLALRGGGYDLVIRSEIGLATWWIVLLGVLVGVFPVRRVSRTGWIAVGLLGGFAVWTGIAATWSENAEQTMAEFGRVVAYLGFFVLGLCVVRRNTVRSLVTGVGTAIGVISALALLSRLHPSLFPSDQVAAFFPGSQTRLSYPLNYANGTGEFLALGIPLLLMIVSSGRTLAGRALGASTIPIAVLGLVLTISRGGIIAAIIGVLAFYALAPHRLSKLAAGVPAAAGSAILIAAIVDRPAVRNDLSTSLAVSQRHELIFLVLAVCTGVAAAQVLIDLTGQQIKRPRALRISRHNARWLTATSLVVALAVAIAAGAPGKLAHEWRVFKRPATTSVGGISRLGTSAGSDLYQYWVAQVHAFETQPLSGIGPGTFQFYWAEHQPVTEPARNGHSLFLQTLAETGLVGLVLLAGFLLVLLATGTKRALRASSRSATRATYAAATASLLAFCAAAGYDWVWLLPAVAIVPLLLGAAILGSDRPAPVRQSRRAHAVVAAAAMCAIIAIVAVAVPFGETVAVHSSQADAKAGHMNAALRDAATAQRLEPYAATPRLQRALILEEAGQMRQARVAIDQATARAPTDSSVWLVRARIEAESGLERSAARDYRQAHMLNPHSATTEY